MQLILNCVRCGTVIDVYFRCKVINADSIVVLVSLVNLLLYVNICYSCLPSKYVFNQQHWFVCHGIVPFIYCSLTYAFIAKSNYHLSMYVTGLHILWLQKNKFDHRLFFYSPYWWSRHVTWQDHHYLKGSEYQTGSNDERFVLYMKLILNFPIFPLLIFLFLCV
jgi:hypothetical protein